MSRGIIAAHASVAPQFRAANANGSGVQQIPASAQVGDYLVAAHMSTDSTPNIPPGFTTILNTSLLDGQFGITSYWAVYGKFVLLGEPGTSVTIDTTGGTYKGSLLAAYSGVHPSSPVNVSGAVGQSLTLNGVTTTRDQCRVVWMPCASEENGGAVYNYSPPAGTTERQEGTGNTHYGSSLADDVQAVAGATGTRAFTCSRLRWFGGAVVALRAAT